MTAPAAALVGAALPRFFAACPLCGGSEGTPFVSHPQLIFWRCATCRLVYKSHAGAEHANDAWYDGDFQGAYEDYRTRRFRHRVGKTRRQIRAALHFVPTARRLLDVGCSQGYALQAARELGLEPSGIDVSPKVVEACRGRGFDAACASLEALPYEANTFDVVLMKHVLEHARDPSKALGELRRVLGPRGIAVIAVPDLGYRRLASRPETRRGFDPRHTGREHHVYYEEETLAAILVRHGFVIYARSKATPLRPRDAMQRLLEPARLATVWLWQGLARRLRMRRELFFVVGRRD